jgi:hypothetical protein
MLQEITGHASITATLDLPREMDRYVDVSKIHYCAAGLTPCVQKDAAATGGRAAAQVSVVWPSR